jgi:hypothetical protein
MWLCQGDSILILFLFKINLAQGDFPHSEDPYEFLPIPMMLAKHLEWGQPA